MNAHIGGRMSEVSTATGRAPVLRRFRRWWQVVAVATAVAVVAGVAVTGGVLWDRSTAAQRDQAFRTQAATIASAVSTALARVDDLATNTGAMLAQRPDVTPVQWAAWLRSVDVTHRYSSVVGFGFARVIAAADLHRFLPAPPGQKDASPRVVPSGRRASYCLLTLRYGDLLSAWPANLDVCGWSANPLAHALDTGMITVLSAPVGREPSVMIAAPVYRGGGVPATREQRRAAALGVVGGFFDGQRVLTEALGSQHQVALQLLRQDASTAGSVSTDRVATAALGTVRATQAVLAAAGAVHGSGVLHRRITLSADGHWILDVTAGRVSGLSSFVQGVVVAAVSFLILVLVALLLALLAVSRRRALALVRRRTVELQRANSALARQAHFDALTGLLNRAGFYEHVDAHPERSRCLLLVDIDDFKGVNDRFGHLAGDTLLRQAAERLRHCVRGSDDVIARLGGDEFVVLLGPPATLAQGRRVAERIVAEFGRPFELDAQITAAVGASVGVADCALSGSLDDALVVADELMYAAKNSGKGSFFVQEPVVPAPRGQDSPTISPSASMSMRSAAGDEPSPGIVRMSPQTG